jgi:UDP-glucose 4-epimerase
MKNILVTGGAGYIGSHTCKLLHKKNYNICVFDNLTTGCEEFCKYGTFFKGDVTDKNDLGNCFEQFKPDIIIHFAALAHVDESIYHPDEYYRVNVIGTINILDTMYKFGCHKIVYSSSCATYGIPEKLPILETTLQEPIHPYGMSKLMTEKIIFDYHKAFGIKYIILRYFNVVGNDPDCDIGEWHNPEKRILPNIIKAAIYNKDFNIYGNDYQTVDGTCERDYIHVLDLANAHILALENVENIQDVFNLGNGKPISNIQLIKKVEEISGLQIKINWCDRRQGDPPILYSDNTKSVKILGHINQYTLEDIVRSSYNWYKKRLFKE